jgi:16S rRNA (guanine966-N2)-methyltransferase
MRVIGGSLRGRRLSAFKGVRIRPTTDRVREAVFNIITALLPRSRALDLFAGTGAMGIEALSRGVDEAHFVDSNSTSVEIIKKNIEELGLSERAKIIKKDVDGFLDTITKSAERYDLLFIDPPYNAGITVQTLEKVAASEALEKGAIVVVEAGKHEPIEGEILDRGFSGLTQIDFRKYGDSLIYIFKRDG